MTPLAQQIVRELTLPKDRRTIEDRCGLLSMMDDIHCFEITDVLPLVIQCLTSIARGGGMDEALAFLPAPKTWIEWRLHDGSRVGYLLDAGRDALAPQSWAALMVPGQRIVTLSESISLPLLQRESEGFPNPTKAIEKWVEKTELSSVGLCLGAIPIINTPRVIGRRQHMPHRGLERALVRARPMVGKFPLHAWTEILLRVSPPQDASGEASNEAHLTGQRALHFCRAHLRIRMGKLERVSAHWRGDAALGIKRSRYLVSS